jgi:cation-transporting ATPase 13A3/4/5
VPIKSVEKMDYGEEFLVGMVTCHSLTIIDNKLSGDPLDLKVSSVFIILHLEVRA